MMKRRELALETFFQTTSEAIIITDERNNIIDVNPAFTTITGFDRQEVIGENPKLLSSGHHNADFYKGIWSTINTKGVWEGEVHNRKKSGEVYVEKATFKSLRNGEAYNSGYLAVFSDITKSKNTNDELFRKANFDTLTGLPNRTLLFDRVSQLLVSSVREKRSVAILFIDLDGFKRVNDSLGHEAGDELLKIASGRMKGCVRQNDTVSRLGGDEFVIVLSNVQSSLDAGHVAEKIILRLNDPFTINGEIVSISASIGISIAPGDGDSVSELIRKADMSMYQAKMNGRSNFQFFVPSLETQNDQQNISNWDLKKALNEQELTVRFQPIISSATGEVLSGEALISWQHPKLGRVSPEVFIPIAEDIGLIDEIGTYVLEKSCELLNILKEMGHSNIKINVNVSPRQLRGNKAPDKFLNIVKNYGVAPSQIVLELTENVFLSDQVRLKGLFAELREFGFDLALDDFGTGYSSLSWLSDFPFTTIKVDKSFVQETILSEEKANLVEAMVAIGKTLGMSVVAEGVETVAQRRFLENIGCEKLQGYLYSPAITADEFVKLPMNFPLDGFDGLKETNIEYLRWTDELSVGNAVLDEDHKGLILIFNRFFDAMSLRLDTSHLTSIFDELIQLAQRHFRREEAILTAIDFDNFDEHRRVHQSLENTLLASRERLKRTGSDFERDKFRRFLINWLVNHIMHEDKEYMTCLIENDDRVRTALNYGAS